MAIRHKRKATTAYTWLNTDLVDGQIGINTVDGTLHVLKTDNTVKTIDNNTSQIDTVSTTDATLTTIGTVAITSGKSVVFSIMGTGRNTTNGDTYSVKIDGCIKNVAGTTSMVGAINTIEFNDVGASSWLIEAVADDTTDTLDINVTGAAATNVDWKTKITTVEV